MSPSHTRTITFTLAALSILTLFAFWPLHTADFINLDDAHYVTENPPVRAGLTPESIRWAWTEFHAGFWAPVLWMSYMLDISLFGLDGGAFHMVNVFWHIVCVVLLFVVLYESTGSIWRSMMVTAVAAVHPLRVESVAWIAERKDVLSLALGLMSMWAYVRYVKKPRIEVYLLTILCFAAGLMTKSILVTLPCVFLLMDFWPLHRWPGKPVWPLVREKIPLFGLTILFCILTFAAHRAFGGVQDTVSLTPLDRLQHGLVACIWYLYKIAWPTDLALFYPYAEQPHRLVEVAGAALGLLGITGITLMQWRSRPYLIVGWFWFLGTLVPVSGIVQVGMQAWADRFVYIPMIGLSIAVVWGVADLIEKARIKQPVVAVVSGVLILVMAMMSRAQAATWQHNGSVARQALAVTDTNFIAEVLLGNWLEDQGDEEAAIAQYRQAIAAKSDYFVPYTRLGILLDKNGRKDEAMQAFAKALELNPKLTGIQLMLGRLLQDRGQIEDAVVLYMDVIKRTPTDPQAYYLAGVAWEALEDYQKALAFYTDAARLNPRFTPLKDRLMERLQQEE